jgi:5'-deoxynucleotidase YfbR-like HD superfamily hydrolase
MSENDDECVRLDIRLAGQIRRYHTWPIVGQQSVAEHCWQILRIYLSITNTPDLHMIQHIMFHDIGEHSTGDIPYPVKRDNPVLKEQMEFLELKSQATQMEYWNSFRQTVLSDTDKAFFKQIELVEMAEFGLDQVTIGNNHGFIIANRCLKSVYESSPSPRLAGYVALRLKLFFRQCPTAFVYGMEEDWWFIEKWEKPNASE